MTEPPEKSKTDKPEPVHSQDATIISQRAPDLTPQTTVPVPLKQTDIGTALTGQQLGHFELVEFVGGGGMGTVFRATDLQLERTVAVKILTHQYAQNGETVRRFRVEAQSAARLNHENIARVYYVGEDKGWNFIVFEYIEGENLRELVTRSGPLPIPESINIVAQVANALAHASDRDVVHRDIKPSNVLLTPEGRAKLVDMGLARLRQVESSENDLTVSGVTLGTFDYISPEQGRDPRNADVRSDLYSLGCTMFFMLTGQPPYPEGTVLQKLLSHTSDPLPDPRQLRNGIPDDVVQINLKLLAKKPADRYQHPLELIGDLARSAERNDLQLSVVPVAWPTAPTRRTPWLSATLPWLVPLLLLVLGVTCLDWFMPTKADKLPEIPPATSDAE